MKVNLTARDSTVTTSNKTFNVGYTDKNFFDQLNKEVMAHPKEAKKLKKILFTTHTMLLLILVKNNVALAAPNNPVPQDLTDSLMIVIAVIAAMGVATAIISLMIAGMWKMLFGKAKADEWTVSVLKGLAQVIAAPILVAFIVGLFTLLFSNVAAFQPILSPITTFFHQ